MEGGDAASNDGSYEAVRRTFAREWLARRDGVTWRLALRSYDAVGDRVASSPFARNVSVLVVSTVIGQAAGVLLSPLLTRIFSPDEFGMLSVYSAILAVIGGAACLRYEIAIPQAQTETEAVDLIGVTSLALLLCTVIVSLVCWLLPSSVFGQLGGEFETSMRILLPVGFVVFGLYTLLLYVATRAQSFDILARARISQGVGGPLSQIALGLAGLGPTGLALGFVVGQTAGTTLLFKRMIIDRWDTLRDATRAGMLRAVWTNRAFPLITAPATIVDALGSNALIYIVLTQYYPGPVAGYLFLAERVVARPLVMISNSMLMVFISELGRYKLTEPAKLRTRFRQITSKQFLIGVAWVAVIDVVSLLAFPSIFGDKWAEAVPYLIVISASHLANNVIQCVSNTLQALGRQALAAGWQLGRVIAVYVGFVVCHTLDASALTAIEVYSAIQVVACIIMYFMIRASVDGLAAAPPPVAIAEPG